MWIFGVSTLVNDFESEQKYILYTLFNNSQHDMAT